LPSFHNWNELHVVLLALGYRQVITKDERIIYKHGEELLMIQKLNKLDVTYILTVCSIVDIKYMDFLNIYEREYARRKRKPADET
jgi:hypothetical protein